MNLSLAIECAEAIAAMYRGDLAPDASENKTDTQYRLEEAHPGEFILIFPGTASLQDFRTDARIIKTTWRGDGAKVHSGFKAAWASVALEIGQKLHRAESVLITGHSLGGALATLAADVIADMGVDVKGVYTFGSPRVGNRSFARQYDEDLGEVTFRVVNARDPVPWLPFPLPVRTGIYTHVGEFLYLLHDGSGIGVGSQLLHPADLVAAVTEQAQEQKFFYDILSARCHQMTDYLAKLKGLKS